MALDSSVALQIVLDAKDETAAAFQSATGRMSGFGSAAKSALGVITGGLGGAAVGILADAARGAAEDEANVLKLKTAVENSGASWEANSAAIEERIKKGQSLAYTDTQIRDSLSLLTAQTGNVEEALKRQVLAMDLARGTGMDLQTASKLLGKVTDENVNVLAKYGINIEKGSDATALFAAVQKKFGGQAEAYGNTTAAAIFKVHDQIDEWKESLGAVLGPAQGVIAMLPGMSSGMTFAGAAIGGLSSLIKLTFIPSLIAMALPFWPIIAVAALVGGAIALLAVAWSNNWGDIQGKVEAAKEFIVAMISGIWTFITETIPKLIGQFIELGRGILQGILDGLGGLKDRLLAMLWEQIQNAISGLKGLLGIHSPSTVFAEIGASMAAGLATGIASGAPQVAEALAGIMPGTFSAAGISPSQLLAASGHRREMLSERVYEAGVASGDPYFVGASAPSELHVYLDGKELNAVVSERQLRDVRLAGGAV